MPGADFEAIEAARRACGVRPSREISEAEADVLIAANRRAPFDAKAAAERIMASYNPPLVPLSDDELRRLPFRVRCALWYRCALCWPVFPCRPDKKPYTAHGYLDATLEPRQILEWWRRWPDALIGVPTGDASGVVVIDIDCKHAEKDGFASLEAAGVRLPATWLVHTRSGGAHFYFRAPCPPEPPLRSGANIRLWGRELPGVDLRADGGYAIVPGARDGYRWSRLRPGRPVLVAPMPARLLEGLRWREPERPAPIFRASGRPADKLVADACRVIATAQPGARQETLAREAWRIGRLVAEGRADHGAAVAALLHAAGSIGGPDWDRKAALATARRRFEAGARGNA